MAPGRKFPWVLVLLWPLLLFKFATEFGSGGCAIDPFTTVQQLTRANNEKSKMSDESNPSIAHVSGSPKSGGQFCIHDLRFAVETFISSNPGVSKQWENASSLKLSIILPTTPIKCQGSRCHCSHWSRLKVDFRCYLPICACNLPQSWLLWWLEPANRDTPPEV